MYYIMLLASSICMKSRFSVSHEEKNTFFDELEAEKFHLENTFNMKAMQRVVFLGYICLG